MAKPVPLVVLGLHSVLVQGSAKGVELDSDASDVELLGSWIVA